MLAKALRQAAGGTEKLYVDDVFSTYLHDGNDSTQTITNGIDLSGAGGMVWAKQRSGTGTHYIVDSTRGINPTWSTYYRLDTSSTSAETSSSAGITAFTQDGFGVTGSGTAINATGQIYTSWTFRNAPKFFTHTTVSHTNGTPTNVDLSSLGEVGMVVAKITNTTGDWITWHRSLTAGNNLRLNTTAAQTTTNAWLSVSGTTATLSGSAPTGTYVIYAWAHDTDPDGMIRCGSYIGNGSTPGPSVELGWEPQFILVKRAIGGVSSWALTDSMRGLTDGYIDGRFYADAASAESMADNVSPRSSGFTLSSIDAGFNSSGSTYIYLAIRIPNKPPTSGTEVFNPVVYTGTNVDNRLVNTGIKTDMAWFRMRNGSGNGFEGFIVGDRLRGQSWLKTGLTQAETTTADGLDQQLVSAVEYGTAFSSMAGVWVGNQSGLFTNSVNINADTTATNHIALAFKRAPGFFDVVCYTGTGAATTIPHQLGVAPELAIIKPRTGTLNWVVFPYNLGDVYLSLNKTNALSGPNAVITSTPSATNISLGTSTNINGSGSNYVAYLFATLPGISKVGSYTGNGTSQTIDCGFSTGARFVLIKNTTQTFGWILFDTARGINAAGVAEPYLLANSTNAESTFDHLAPDSSGFTINSSGALMNSTGDTFIYLAIA